jgi:uncharacterized protein YjbI with pentapeptide repeats
MANQELNILKQGSDIWNAWRQEYPKVLPNLIFANLYGADLGFADLSRTDLQGADLRGANLHSAKLKSANLSYANLHGADLSYADLSFADLNGTTLSYADLGYAILSRADLRSASLYSAKFNRATIGWTIFGDVDLRTVKGLETVRHTGPSTIGTDTLLRSEGDISEEFLRKVGLSDAFIIYARSLAQHPIEYYTCFISYSSKDQGFAERLYADLQRKGVRCWFAPEDMKTGDKIRQRIDESIRLYDKLLLVLSQDSIKSVWVEFEVEAALSKEQTRNATVLFPVRLDAAVLESATSWAAHLQRTRHITDFTRWKQHDDYQKAFARLLRDLQPDTPPTGEK